MSHPSAPNPNPNQPGGMSPGGDMNPTRTPTLPLAGQHNNEHNNVVLTPQFGNPAIPC